MNKIEQHIDLLRSWSKVERDIGMPDNAGEIADTMQTLYDVAKAAEGFIEAYMIEGRATFEDDICAALNNLRKVTDEKC